jgi:ribA/ribD-fused uncharacterized protein
VALTEIKGFVGRYSFLSNFHIHPVFWDDRSWRSSEHAYQAAKSLNLKEQEWIREAVTPAIAKNRGSNKKLPKTELMRCTLRPDWEDVKIPIMKEILLAKFSDPHLASLLRNTGEAYLEESTWWNDKFWGTYKGVGQNNLGILLMQVREELQ